MRSTSLFSQRVDCVTPDQVFREVLLAVKKKKQSLFFALNIHILLLLEQDIAFRQKHSQAKIIFADGVPLVWLSQLTENTLPARVSGTDLVERILKEKSLKIFLLGSTTPVLRTLSRQFSNVAGWYAPPFSVSLNVAENKKIIALIDRSRATVLMVALGPLKQEEWLVQNLKKTQAAVGIGVGSALDILAGTKPRAPRLLQRLGLEWLWRIGLEPKRLGKRYFQDMYGFAKLFFRPRKYR